MTNLEKLREYKEKLNDVEVSIFTLNRCLNAIERQKKDLEENRLEYYNQVLALME